MARHPKVWFGFQLLEMEQKGAGGGEEYAERLRQMGVRLHEAEKSLIAARKEAASYQDMLQQSQVSLIIFSRVTGG